MDAPQRKWRNGLNLWYVNPDPDKVTGLVIQSGEEWFEKTTPCLACLGDMMFRKTRNKVSQSLNRMFLNLNRWQGRKLNEVTLVPINAETYNFERHAKRTLYHQGQELEDHLIEQIGSIKTIIKHCEQTPYEDTHMLAVWMPALRDTERKLSELQLAQQERFPKYSIEMTYLTRNIDRYEKILTYLDKDCPTYDTIFVEVKRLRRRWGDLARDHNPVEL